MIRVAISEENGFQLSDEAVLLCVERGMILAPYEKNRLNPNCDFFEWGERHLNLSTQKYGTRYNGSNELRTNPIVLSVLEELGDRAMHPLGEEAPRLFKIIEIPFESTEGWHIRDFECGTGEYIVENHRTWH